MKKTRKKVKAEIVFRLIKKMSRSDKRYFKLTNQNYKKDKDFLKLFDYLNTQEELDLLALEKFFTKKNITNPNLCIKYLHNKIMDTLQGEARKSLRNKIQIYNENIEQHLDYCNIYLYADLPELALKEIHEAEETASRLEDYNYLLRIHHVHREALNITHLNHHKYQELKREVVNKIEWTLNQLLLINQVSDITRKMMFITDPNSSDHQETFHKIQEYAARLKELPVICQHAILRAQAHHCYLQRNLPKMLNIQKQIIALWEPLPYERWNLNEYIIGWGNLLLVSVDSSPRSEINSYFTQYIELPKKHPTIFKGPTETFRRTYFIIRYSLEARLILNYEEYDKIYATEQDFAEGLSNFAHVSTLANVIQTICLRIVLVHLILGNYDRCDHWINHYYQLPDVQNDVWYSTCEILEVMMHYDQKNHVYLASKIRNLKRQWQKEEPPSPNVPILLRLIEKVLQKSNQSKTSDIWTAGLQEMYEAEKSRALYFIKLSRWVEKQAKQNMNPLGSQQLYLFTPTISLIKINFQGQLLQLKTLKIK